MVMGIVLAFQLGVSPLLAQVEALGDARYAIPSVAIARLDGAEGVDDLAPLHRRDRRSSSPGPPRARRRPLADPHPGDLESAYMRRLA